MDNRNCTLNNTFPLTLFKCPVTGNEIKEEVISFPNKQNHLRNALIIGLLVGLSSFKRLYRGTDRLSFRIIAGVVSGIFSAYLSYSYLNKKNNHKDLKICPAGARLKLSDNGFFGPDSITWKTGSDPSYLIAGVSAGLLQILHPDVVRMIEKSGKFYRNPEGRAERTALHRRSTIYGDKKTAMIASEAFIELHNSLIAENPVTGERYSASKPELLLWVHNSLTWMILRTFKMYGPKLTTEEENQFVQEENKSAQLIGLEEKILPKNTKELDAYMVKMLSQLALNKDSIRFRDFLIQKGFPSSISVAIKQLFISAGIRLMLPEHQKLFGFQSSTLRDVSVQTVTSIMIRIIRFGFPAAYLIPKKRAELVENSFGKQARSLILKS